MLTAIGELSSVAGGHARSLFEMAPRSIVVRVGPSLVAGFDSYGFDAKGEFPELVQRIAADDLPGKEFLIGGEFARTMPSEQKKALSGKGVQFDDNPQRLLAAAGDRLLGKKS